VSDKTVVSVIVEYDDDIPDSVEDVIYRVTLKADGEILTNDYVGVFVGSIVQDQLNHFFSTLNILDQFGYIEMANPLLED